MMLVWIFIQGRLGFRFRVGRVVGLVYCVGCVLREVIKRVK